MRKKDADSFLESLEEKSNSLKINYATITQQHALILEKNRSIDEKEQALNPNDDFLISLEISILFILSELQQAFISANVPKELCHYQAIIDWVHENGDCEDLRPFRFLVALREKIKETFSQHWAIEECIKQISENPSVQSLNSEKLLARFHNYCCIKLLALNFDRLLGKDLSEVLDEAANRLSFYQLLSSTGTVHVTATGIKVEMPTNFREIILEETLTRLRPILNFIVADDSKQILGLMEPGDWRSLGTMLKDLPHISESNIFDGVLNDITLVGNARNIERKMILLQPLFAFTHRMMSAYDFAQINEEGYDDGEPVSKPYRSYLKGEFTKIGILPVKARK